MIVELFISCQILFMKSYSHPEMKTITLPVVMQALSDPGRIAIVKELLRAEGKPLACNEVKLDVSKATRSHHFDVLRSAGIIRTEADGTKCMTSIRKTELNKYFPGLLKLIGSGK